MKILNRYILKNFLIPFIATFLIILFVLVMQMLWLQFDKIAGKGIDIATILKLLGYMAQMVVPQALPIAILLSSIMALGNMSENYEFAAIKSAGVSLQKFLRPLILLMVVLSGLNFLFLNYAFPRAAFKFKNLLIDMQKTKPALSLIPGTFNTEIPGYSIKFAEKYGEKKNLLRDVHIYYDLNKNNGNTKVIKAETGEITTESGSKYMTLILRNGYHYEDIIPKNRAADKMKRMPFTKSYFDEYKVNIDVSKLSKIDAANYKKDREMLSLSQLTYYTDSLKTPYDQYIKNKAESFYLRSGAKEMYIDSLKPENKDIDILANFDSIQKVEVLNKAIGFADWSLSDIESFRNTYKRKQKSLNTYNVEYHRRLAFSLACLVLFFIGAPLGSIIRKGGFGLPMILAIIIFVIYFFMSTLGRNMALSSTVTSVFGGWLATIILLPFGILLTHRATNDKGIFDLAAFLAPITNVFDKILPTKDELDIENFNQANSTVTISESDLKSKEKFTTLHERKLFEIIRNYKQYNYTKGERQLAINVLEERGITTDNLKYSGKLSNHNFETASRNFTDFKKYSKIAFVFYILASIIGSVAASGGFGNTPFKAIGYFGLFLTVFLYLAYVTKSFANHKEINKILDGKLGADLSVIYVFLATLFYIVFYFILVRDIDEKLKQIT